MQRIVMLTWPGSRTDALRTLEEGNKYVFKYRMFVYDGKMDAVKAERAWQDFGNPPKITVTK